MIAVVALNPALDVTHHVDGVDWAGVNRPATVHAMPGGKGVNVARVLHALGDDVLLLGLAGGSTGATVQAGLRSAGVPASFTQIAGETRRTFVVFDTGSGDAALFNEPGPLVTADEYSQFHVAYAAAMNRCSAVVLSGSLPQGLPADTFAELVRIAESAGVPAVLDTSGPALLRGAAAGPAIVKPNLGEIAAAAGRELRWASAGDRAEVVAAATELRDCGAGAVVVSLSADGLLAVTGAGSWHAVSAPVRGNPTGAGDAAVAGLTHGLIRDWGWPERLRHAAALGAAAVVAPTAGEFRPEDYARALATIEVRQLEHA